MIGYITPLQHRVITASAVILAIALISHIIWDMTRTKAPKPFYKEVSIKGHSYFMDNQSLRTRGWIIHNMECAKCTRE